MSLRQCFSRAVTWHAAVDDDDDIIRYIYLCILSYTNGNFVLYDCGHAFPHVAPPETEQPETRSPRRRRFPLRPVRVAINHKRHVGRDFLEQIEHSDAKYPVVFSTRWPSESDQLIFNSWQYNCPTIVSDTFSVRKSSPKYLVCYGRRRFPMLLTCVLCVCVCVYEWYTPFTVGYRR